METKIDEKDIRVKYFNDRFIFEVKLKSPDLLNDVAKTVADNLSVDVCEVWEGKPCTEPTFVKDEDLFRLLVPKELEEEVFGDGKDIQIVFEVLEE